MKQTRKTVEAVEEAPLPIAQDDASEASPVRCDPYAELTDHMRSIFLQPEDIIAARAADMREEA